MQSGKISISSSLVSRFTRHFANDLDTLRNRNDYAILTGVGNDNDFLYDSSYYHCSSSRKYQPSFFIFLNHNDKEIVIAIRGTLSFHDLMVDLTCKSTTLEYKSNSYFVHSGMLKAAYNIAENQAALNIINEALSKHITYKLTITGHSLGAGLLILNSNF